MHTNRSHTNEGGLRKQLYRLVNKQSGHYLHLSATGDTADVNYAWAGCKQQARTLRNRFGPDWPYETVRRDG